MDSSEDEDIHQCGRCKEIFHSIDEYFEHKKAKSCRKLKDDPRVVSAFVSDVVGSAEEPSSASSTKQAATCRSTLDDSVTSGIQTVNKDGYTRGTRVGRRGNRRGRPRKGQQGRHTRPTETGIIYHRKREGQPVDNRGTSIKLRDRGKIFPKKKWADAFEETSSENCDLGDDVTSGAMVGDGDFSRKRRGRPPKSTTYSHIMKPARPYPRENNFFCPECDHVTNHRDEYDRHLRVCHRLSTYICPTCHLPFGDKYKLRRHQEKKVCSREADPNVPTPKFMQFKSTNRIYRHAVSDAATRDKAGADAARTNVKVTGGARYAAKSTSGDLRVDDDVGNVINCADINEFTCLECDEFFSCYSAIMDHLKKQHPGILPGICQFCGKWFSSKYRLWRHMTSSVHDHVSADLLAAVKKDVGKLNVKWKASNKQKHERCRKYSCVKCKKTFNARSLYLHHMKKVHNPSEISQKNVCDWCGLIITCSQTAFEKHLDVAHHVKARDSYCTCTVCNKVFNQRSHVTRHREALHTPSRQVPSEHLPQNEDFMSTADGRDLTSFPGTKTQESADSEQVDRGVADYGKVFTCFVCCHHFEYKHAYRDHLELHRVWVPDRDKDGPFPKDLFSSATYRSLTLTSEPSADLVHKENNNAQESCTVTDPDIGQNPCEVTLETMEQDGINILDDEQTETSRVLKMIMQLDSGACESALPSDKVTRAIPDQGGNYSSDWNSTASPYSSGDVGGQQRGGSDSQTCKDVSCPYCRMVFSSLEDRYQHAVNHHRLASKFKCVFSSCSKIFSGADEYQAHSEVHSQKAFICNSCNEHVSSLSLLLAHKAAIHRNTFPSDNKCTVCRASFPDRKELEHHLILSEFVHFPCSVCSKVLRSEEELASHQQVHYEVKPYLCELCGTGFSNNVALQRHRTNHSNARPHKCADCESSFNKREHLLRHVISKHSDLKPFSCQTCGKSFKRRDKLYEHQRVHGTEKPYACSQCGLRYRYREGLKYHEKTHARDKKYACAVCSVHFPRPGQLKKHLLEQHNIRSREQHMYPCSLCNMSFSRPERVRRHMERVHGSPVQWQAVCQVCDKGFPGEKSLNTHMTQAHNSPDAAAVGKNKTAVGAETPAKTPAAPAIAQLSEGANKTADAEVQRLYQLVSDGDTSGQFHQSTVPVADQSATCTATTTSMMVSKTATVSADGGEPVTVFMYVHPPVQPNGESVRQTVVAQSEANIEMTPSLHETMNLADIAHDTPAIAPTVSYLPNYDQALSLTTVNPTQYSADVDNYNGGQYGVPSQGGAHQKQLHKQDDGAQSLDVQDQQSESYPLIAQTSHTLEPSLSLSQLSYKFNVSQENSATQQLFQLISLEAIQSAPTAGSGVVTPANIPANPATCQTLSTIQNMQAVPKAASIQTASGQLQSNPVLLTASTQHANQLPSVVHMIQNNPGDQGQTLHAQQQHIVQQQLQQHQQQAQQNHHHHQQQQQQPLQVVQQQSLLQLAAANGQLSSIGQQYSLQPPADITSAVFTPLLNISGTDTTQT